MLSFILVFLIAYLLILFILCQLMICAKLKLTSQTAVFHNKCVNILIHEQCLRKVYLYESVRGDKMQVDKISLDKMPVKITRANKLHVSFVRGFYKLPVL